MDMLSILVYVYIFIHPYKVGPSKCPLYMNFLNCTLYYEYPCTYVHTVLLLYIFKTLSTYCIFLKFCLCIYYIPFSVSVYAYFCIFTHVYFYIPVSICKYRCIDVVCVFVYMFSVCICIFSSFKLSSGLKCIRTNDFLQPILIKCSDSANVW